MNEARVLEFDRFAVDLGQRLLLVGDRPLPLTPKAFDTLAALVQAPGQVLTKEELLARIWPDSFVEDGILSQNIYTLRKVLAAAGGASRYIETVPRRGYRFAGRVFERRPSEAAEGPITTLAILPFEAWTQSEEDAYLGLGLADALVSRMAELQRLTVRPTSLVRPYHGKPRDPVAVGRELKVDAVLDGTIQRSGRNLRLSVQLISVRDAAPLWATRFDVVVGDLFALEDTLSQQLAQELKLQLTHQERDRLTRRPTRDPEAYQDYLRGRFFWNRRTGGGLGQAIDCFTRAIELDPAYAPALAGLADCYVLLPLYAGVAPRLAFPRAIAAAEKALAIDGSLAEAHTSLAYARLFYDRDLGTAEQEFKRALACDPAYPTAHQWNAFLLAARGRHDEAIACARMAHDLDPLSLVINSDLGLILYFARRYEEAIRQFRRTLELDPAFSYGHFGLGHALQQEGRLGEAVAELGRAAALAPESSAMLAAVGQAAAAAGDEGEARRILAELGERSVLGYVDASHFAFVHLGLGERELALDRLEEACEERSRFVALLATWPIFDSLRGEPRFARLLQQAGIAARPL